MGGARLLARFDDGYTLWGRYNGTVDGANVRLVEVPTLETDFYESPGCTCGHPSEDVEIYADYGSGLYWTGTKACRRCLCLTENRNPWHREDDYDFSGGGFGHRVTSYSCALRQQVPRPDWYIAAAKKLTDSRENA